MDGQRSKSELRIGAYAGVFSPDRVDWREIRDQFLLRDDVIYMNSGTQGSMPRRTLEKYRAYNLDWARSPSYCFFDSGKLGALNYQQANRAAMGQFIGADWADICLTNNTTMALAMAILGLPLERDDEILTSDQEHWALLAPLTLLSERGIKVVHVPIQVPLGDGSSVVEAFSKRITKRTRVIAVSHITWGTGAQLPVQQLCSLARENKKVITVIDGAHALGALSLDVTKLGCDFYASSGHKWLNGPPGTGILYIRNAACNPSKLSPLLSENIPNIAGEPISTRLQIRGCNNTASFAGMVDSAAFSADLGRDVIERRILNLSAYTKGRIMEAWGTAALFSPNPSSPDLCSGMTSFVPSSDPAAGLDLPFINAVVNALWNQSRIYVRSVPFPSPVQPEKVHSAIRVSTHIFNSFCQIDLLIDEMCRIVKALENSGDRSGDC
jgi:selenocysteine lyase/cysteine desulfurase